MSANILFTAFSISVHQPYVDTLYVLSPCRHRPKLVLTGTSIPEIYVILIVVNKQVRSVETQEDVGLVTKQWSGLAKEMFTDAENFGISCKYLVLG